MADADSQGAAVAALRALAWLDPGRAAHWHDLESRLRARVTAAFRPGVLALEADDRPVLGAGSHLGWLSWSGERWMAPPSRRPRTGWRSRTSSQGPECGPCPAGTLCSVLYAYHRGAAWALARRWDARAISVD